MVGLTCARKRAELVNSTRGKERKRQPAGHYNEKGDVNISQ